MVLYFTLFRIPGKERTEWSTAGRTSKWIDIEQGYVKTVLIYYP
jgi:hypothetical protein